MIKRIELINFMSHRQTVIEPAAGLTVLTGPNNCGKSAVLTALQVLCYNDNSTFVKRHGEKESSITVETDDGHKIVWRRKGGSVSYEIDGQLFDRLNRQAPDRLHEVLKLPRVEAESGQDEINIHFANQKEPIFLLNESGRTAAGFFAASSDASRLIQMQKLHNNQVRDANRDLARLNRESSSLEQELEELAEVPGLVERFDAVEATGRETDLEQRQIDRLRSLLSGIAGLFRSVESLEQRSAELKQLHAPPEITATGQLAGLVSSLQQQRRQLESRKLQHESFSRLKPVPTVERTEPLSQLIAELRSRRIQLEMHQSSSETAMRLKPPPTSKSSAPLAELVSSLDAARESQNSIERQQQQLESQINQLSSTVDAWSKENPACPACNRPWTSEQLKSRIGIARPADG